MSLISINDFVCGLMAGWSQVIIGQPFDFIKTKFQTQKINRSIGYWIKNIFMEHGFMGFYRGSSSIFFGFGGIIALEFSILELCKRNFKVWHNIRQAQLLPIKMISLSGVIVGLTTSLVYCPIQYTKLLMQTQKTNTVYDGSLSALFQIFRKFGISQGLRKLYTGLLSTISRESFGSMIYYSAYQVIIRKLTENRTRQASVSNLLFSGSACGVIYWTFSYPSDVIKTIVQTTNSNYASTIKTCFRQNRLYRGFGVVLMRCIPVNAVNFLIYESMQKALNMIWMPQF